MPEPRKLVPVDYRTLIQIFERDGFKVSRQKGDHVSMTKPGVLRPLVIKTSPRKVPGLPTSGPTCYPLHDHEGTGHMSQSGVNLGRVIPAGGQAAEGAAAVVIGPSVADAFGGLEEAAAFQRMTAGILAVSHHPPAQGPFLAQAEAVLRLAGVPEPMIRAGLEEFSARLEALGTGA